MVCTTYEENRLLDYFLGNGTPATIYVGLCTGVSAGGVVSGEPSGNGYARVAVTNNATNWPAASGGAKSNGAQINFPAATGAWGTVTYYFLSDASSGNTNSLGSGSISSISPVYGNTVYIPAGGINVTLS